MATSVPEVLTLADLKTCFQQIGIVPGTVLEVHSSVVNLYEEMLRADPYRIYGV